MTSALYFPRPAEENRHESGLLSRLATSAYMLNAMWVSAMVGGSCAFLSCYLMLKGWSLIGAMRYLTLLCPRRWRLGC